MHKLIIIYFIILPSITFPWLKDYGFKPLREKIRYKEDFIRLYNQWLYSDLDSISRNIFFLELAYCVPFDHPIKALIPITNTLQYEKYKNLIMMHICLLLTQAYIDYAKMYIKENIYFFNEEFKNDYIDGYLIAEKYIKDAHKYWLKTKDYAYNAKSIKEFKMDNDFYIYHLNLEDEAYKILNNLIKYDKVIRLMLEKIEKNKQTIKDLWGE